MQEFGPCDPVAWFAGRFIRKPRDIEATMAFKLRGTSAEVEARIAELRGKGMGKIKIAKTLGIGVSTVQRVVG